MRVHRHSNAAEFLSSSESWLLDAEPENNLIIGLAYQSRSQGGGLDEYWATVCNGDEIVGAAFRTPPYPLGVTRMPADAIPALLDDVEAVYQELPGVGGPIEVVEQLAPRWRNRHGVAWHVKFHQRIHVLTRPAIVGALPPGRLRRMSDSDENVIWEWMAAFVRDTGTSAPPKSLVQRQLDQRRFYFWDDNGSRCMLAAARDTPGGACITAVYTPFAYRRNGYATAAVAALSKNLLNAGKRFCCLYTDLSNPTSNAIYARIGYEPVRDDMELVFKS